MITSPTNDAQIAIAFASACRLGDLDAVNAVLADVPAERFAHVAAALAGLVSLACREGGLDVADFLRWASVELDVSDL